jgi:hypothetical protein
VLYVSCPFYGENLHVAFCEVFYSFVKRSGITGGIGPGLRGKMSRRRDILFTILHTDFREFRTF